MTNETDKIAERTLAAQTYYEALDNHEYGRLETILTPEFVHIRPDMTLNGRDRFIEFMREERPMTETTHPIERIYQTETDEEIAVKGRLVAKSGETITGFVDIFSFNESGIEQLRTYTD